MSKKWIYGDLVYLVNSECLRILHAASCCVPCCVPALVAWKPPGHVKGSAHLIASWAEHDETRCQAKDCRCEILEKYSVRKSWCQTCGRLPNPFKIYGKFMKMPRACQHHLWDWKYFEGTNIQCNQQSNMAYFKHLANMDACWHPWIVIKFCRHVEPILTSISNNIIESYCYILLPMFCRLLKHL